MCTENDGNSIPRSDHPRRPHGSVSPCVPQVAPGSAELGASRPAARALLRPPSQRLEDIFPRILCILARRVRRRPRMGPDEAEQKEVDRARGPAARVAGREAQARGTKLDPPAAGRQDGQGLLL